MTTRKTKFSIQQLISDPSTLDNIRNVFSRPNFKFFLPVFDEAVAGLSSSDSLDKDFIEYMSRWYEVRLNQTRSPYLSFSEFGRDSYQRNPKREVDKLLGKKGAVLDSPYFSFLALKLCIEAANNICDDVRVPYIVELYGEASEANALSRLASFCVDVLSDYEDLLDATIDKKEKELSIDPLSATQRKSIAARRNVKRKHELDTIKLQQTVEEICALCDLVWKEQPYIPVGIMGDVIEKLYKNILKRHPDFFIPESRKLKAFLKETAPVEALFTGRPRHGFPLSGMSTNEKVELTEQLIKKYAKKGGNLPELS